MLIHNGLLVQDVLRGVRLEECVLVNNEEADSLMIQNSRNIDVVSNSFINGKGNALTLLGDTSNNITIHSNYIVNYVGSGIMLDL